MPDAAPRAIAVARALDRVMRDDRGRLIAALVARLGAFQPAEDALHEAMLAALVHWGRSGLPRSPRGWLLTVALRKALDRLRAEGRAARRAGQLALLAGDEGAEPPDPGDRDIPDERLRLVFACCHPALEPKTRVALTLRSVCGLSTDEVARVFLDTSPAMGQRLSRARAQIQRQRLPFAVPGPEDWDARLGAVLATVYLTFTTGYTAGPAEPRDLCAEAIFLARLICDLRPGEAEAEALLALMLLTDARRAARVGQDGATVPPALQDRSLWNAAGLAEGRAVLEAALRRRAAGPYALKAAIAACQMAEGGPDWPQIAALYGALLRHEPTAVVRLNHAVAVAEAGDPQAGLALLAPLAAELGDFQPFHAARAALLSAAGEAEGARTAYDRAIALAPSEADRRFLTARRDRGAGASAAE